MKPKVLFILKERHINYGVTEYGDVNPYGYNLSSGLLNSAKFMNDMLVASGFVSNLVEVVDNNSIDREVTKYRPDVVIIEAFWVVPEKFEVLRKLHPKVIWIIRLHSELPFLSNEGVAIDWMQRSFNQQNVLLAPNSEKTTRDIIGFFNAKYPLPGTDILSKIVFLPNYYPVDDSNTPYALGTKSVIDVGCFGAIRPMKNQLIQAFAAIEFARTAGVGLNFHINSVRVERGDNALVNIRALFKDIAPRYNLIEHDWLEHDPFVQLVRTMDIGMQASLSETFNIVAADFINNGVPFVGTKEIPFIYSKFQVDVSDTVDMVKKMNDALLYKKYLPFFSPSKTDLIAYVVTANKVWVDYLNNVDIA